MIHFEGETLWSLSDRALFERTVSRSGCVAREDQGSIVRFPDAITPAACAAAFASGRSLLSDTIHNRAKGMPRLGDRPGILDEAI